MFRTACSLKLKSPASSGKTIAIRDRIQKYLRGVSHEFNRERRLISKKLKAKLRALADDTPGERFQNHYYKVHASGGNVILRKFVFLAGGLVVLAAGIFFLPAPGPGMVIVAIGAAMIAQESLVVAKWLDAIEVKGRKLLPVIKKKWKQIPGPAKVSAIIALLLCAAGLVYGSYTLIAQWRAG